MTHVTFIDKNNSFMSKLTTHVVGHLRNLKKNHCCCFPGGCKVTLLSGPHAVSQAGGDGSESLVSLSSLHAMSMSLCQFQCCCNQLKLTYRIVQLAIDNTLQTQSVVSAGIQKALKRVIHANEIF